MELSCFFYTLSSTELMGIALSADLKVVLQTGMFWYSSVHVALSSYVGPAELRLVAQSHLL